MDNLCPWSKPQRTWSSPRGYQRQMEPLDRRERHDPFMSRPPFAPQALRAGRRSGIREYGYPCESTPQPWFSPGHSGAWKLSGLESC